MAIRKRKWTTKNGEEHEAWVVFSGAGKNRHAVTFKRKRDADDYAATVRVDVRRGVHVAPARSITVREAGKQWIEACEAAGLERTTVDAYRNHLDFHIYPYIGGAKLSTLTVVTVRAFQDNLRLGKPAPGQTEALPRSADMIKRVTGSLGALLADAQELGKVAQNVVRSLKSNRRRGKDRQAERRAKGKLKIDVDIPTPAEIDAILEKVTGRWRPLFLVAIRCGLRASEIRGLCWADIEFERERLHVRQRADRFNKIGRPKSDAGERIIPIPKTALAALREWKLVCPKGAAGLVFPTGAGNIESRGNIVNRGLIPVQLAAGVTVNGKPKYPGLHALRHYFASWCINRKVDGGLELPAKVVQERLGHSSIVMTMDTYGHLFPAVDDSAALAAAEGRFG